MLKESRKQRYIRLKLAAQEKPHVCLILRVPFVAKKDNCSRL